MNTPILEVSDIQKYYGNKGNITKAVNRISLSVGKGEFVGIMGASGSGKTTLLNCISTIDTVTSGKILVEGKDITTLRGKQLSAFRREKLGFIFQDFNLLDTLTAYENIPLALSISGIKAKDIDTRVTGRSTGHPIRTLRNEMTKRYTELEEQGASFEELEHLTLGGLRNAVVEGDVKNGSVMAGQIAGMVKERMSCKELIDKLVRETDALMKGVGLYD